MSRTDKDAPDYARATWFEPWHFSCDGDDNLPAWRRRTRRACDLPAEPRRKPVIQPGFASGGRGCVWVPVSEIQRCCSPTRETLRATWHGPIRARLRLDVRQAIAEHRATGQVEVVITPWRRRENSRACGRSWW
jgi:hypothetical protein